MLKKARLSLITCLLLAFAILAVRFISTPYRALSWDVFGYYLYLPANFIFHDPGLTDHAWLDKLIDQYEPTATLYQLVEGSDGNRIIKYTSGLALLYAPFFFAAHWLAPLMGYPADGFSLPYQLILSFGGILWAIAGLLIFRKLLLQFFDDKITAITMLLIVAGTNYFQLASLDGTLLSHNFLFTFYALLLLATFNWHKKPTWKSAFLIGISCGFIALIRPSEGICILIPLLWNTGTKKALQNKISQIRRYPPHVAVALIAAIAIGSIQLFYWKKYSGEWLFYSYNNPGEGFRFFPPYLPEFLFSFRKGWFIYTPLMIFAAAGFYHLYRKNRAILPALLLFFLLDLWIISAWSCWWYAGGSFSARAIVPAYVVLAIPLGFLISDIARSKLRWVAVIAGVFLVIFNLFQSWQFQKGIIDKERMTRAYYMSIFGKTLINRDNLDKLLLVSRNTVNKDSLKYPERYTSKIIFGSDTIKSADTSNALRLDSNNAFAAGPDISYDKLTNADHVWIRVSVEILLPKGYTGRSPLLVSAFHFHGQAYKYYSEALAETGSEAATWQKISYWYLSPEVRTKKDNLKVYVWHREMAPVFVRNLKVVAYEPKSE